MHRLVPLALLITAKIIWAPLYFTSGTDLLADRARTDILQRRAYLIDAITSDDFGPERMPAALTQVFKQEWTIGTLSMSSAALTNIAFAFPETREASCEIVRKLIERFMRPDIRVYENYYWNIDALEALDSANGQIGFLGHLNFMLGAYRLLGGDSRYDNLMRRISSALARRMLQSKSAYLETFPNHIFVPDNAVVLASLANAQRAIGFDAQPAITKWLEYTRSNLLDPKTGLIVSWVGNYGEPIGSARGSYAAWSSFYLPFAVPEFAREQFSLLKKHMLQRLPFGAVGLREFPHGERGVGDIDSGPVIFGFSTSGTGFAAGGARHNEDAETLDGLLRTAEIVGSSYSWHGKRAYLLAPLIGEAIMLAMKTARVWDTRYLLVEQAAASAK